MYEGSFQEGAWGPRRAVWYMTGPEDGNLCRHMPHANHLHTHKTMRSFVFCYRAPGGSAWNRDIRVQPTQNGLKFMKTKEAVSVLRWHRALTPYLSPGHLAPQGRHRLLQLLNLALSPLSVGPFRCEVILVHENLKGDETMSWDQAAPSLLQERTSPQAPCHCPVGQTPAAPTSARAPAPRPGPSSRLPAPAGWLRSHSPAPPAAC